MRITGTMKFEATKEQNNTIKLQRNRIIRLTFEQLCPEIYTKQPTAHILRKSLSYITQYALSHM